MTTSRPPERRPFTVRIARWSAMRPWYAIGLWLVFVAACIAVGQSAGLRSATDRDLTPGQSGTALRWLHDAGLTPPDTEDILITARSGPLSTSAAADAATEVRQRMSRLTEVTRVGAPVTSPDGSAVLVEATLRTDAGVTPLLDATAAVQKANPAMRVEQVGSKSLDDAINDQVSRDLSTAASFSLPITLVILLIAFGAIIAAGVPVLLALSSVGAATGLSALASHVLPDAGTTSSMILLMGMAVGVDYSLFYVKRARAERHRGRMTLDAVEIAAETSGHSVLVSGVAVVLALTGLYVVGEATFASLATGSIIVVAVAVLGSLTVLPALLVVLRSRIDRPRVPIVWSWTRQDREPALWSRVLRPSVRHPVRTMLVSAGGLALLALPALGMHLQTASSASLPKSIAATGTLARLTEAFPDTSTTTDVVVRAAAADRGAVRRALTAVGEQVRQDPRFGRRVQSQLSGSADGTVQDLRLRLPFDAESARAHAAVRALRDTVLPRHLARTASARFAVGGDAAEGLDLDSRLSGRLPWAIAVVVALTVLLTGFVFRSMWLALVTAGMNLLSAGAAFGVLTLVFQHHWADGLLGYTSTGRLINWVPLFTFAVLFGLSMDYHVFVINSVREAAADGRSMREAVRIGVSRSAGTVTSAAIVMVSVFAIFAGLHLVELKELGVGLGVAVLVDAVVVRSVLLPSVLVLLGGRIRWTRRPTPEFRSQSQDADLDPYTVSGQKLTA